MLVTVLVLLQAHGDGPSAALLAKDAMTCRDWALAANEYIALGEAQAVAALKRVDAGKRDPFSIAPTRKGLLCRLLFVPRRGRTLRTPSFGGLSLPYRSMPASRWPEYPFAVQDGVCFLLSEAYILAGEAEPTARYVDYCRRAGSFRKASLAVPTSGEAARALNGLLGSPRWKALRWSHKGVGETYEVASERIVEDLRKQARF